MMFQHPVDIREYQADPQLRLFGVKHQSDVPRQKAAILFFHGAGFSTNQVTPAQFQQHASTLASYGILAICVEYRPAAIEGLYSPIHSLAHARSAIRWVRRHAAELVSMKIILLQQAHQLEGS